MIPGSRHCDPTPFALALPQPHARPLAILIDENHAGRMKGVAHVIESAGVGLALPELEVRDRRLSALRCDGQVVLRPSDEPPRGAALCGRQWRNLAFLILTGGIG